MRSLVITILLLGLVVAGFAYFAADGTNGIWGDAKTIKGQKDTQVSTVAIPSS